MTHSYICYLIHMCKRTHSWCFNVPERYRYGTHMTHIWFMTHLNMIHDSFKYDSWLIYTWYLIHMCNRTHSWCYNVHKCVYMTYSHHSQFYLYTTMYVMIMCDVWMSLRRMCDVWMYVMKGGDIPICKPCIITHDLHIGISPPFITYVQTSHILLTFI